MHESNDEDQPEPFRPEDFHLDDTKSTNRHTLDVANDKAHKKRAGVYREDWEKKPSLLSTPTKIMLSVIVIGGLGYGALLAYEYFTMNPDAVDKLLDKGPLSLTEKDDEAKSPEVHAPLMLRGKEVKELEGIIGDTVVGGPYAVEIYDAGTVTKNEAGVAVVALMGAIGNASKEPLSTPPVTVFLVEQDGSRHAASDQRGSYKTGVALNPKLCLKHSWGFVVPDKTRFTHVVFEFPDKQKVQVNLEERTPENLHAVEAQDRSAFEAYMSALSEKDSKVVSVKAHVAGVRNKETSAMRQECDKIQEELDASKLRTANLLVEADKCDKDLSRSDKKLKSVLDNMKHAKLELDKKQQTVDAATERLTELQKAPIAPSDSRSGSRVAQVQDSLIAKADQNLRRAEQHLEEAKAAMAKDEALKRSLEDAIKAQEQDLQNFKGKMDQEDNQEKQIQKRLDDATTRLIDKEKTSIPGVSL